MTSPARSSVTQTTLAGVAGRGLGDAQAVIDEANLDTDITAIPTHAAADLSTTVHGLPKVSVVAGENETVTHQITVTGMAADDTVIAVLTLTSAASIATLAAHAGTLTAAAGKITPGSEVDNTGNQYIVFWINNS